MKIGTYTEVGAKRVFAVAVDWPGWSRSGRDERSALQALLDYGPRYARAVRSAQLGFQPPTETAEFKIVERIKGDMTTDFGAPRRISEIDRRPVDEAQLRRLQAILKGAWRAYRRAWDASAGRSLRVGPRGGGRDPARMTDHVLGAEHAYIRRLGVKVLVPEAAPLEEQFGQLQREALNAVAASAHGELPQHGPRGAEHWPARYFARRSAWHLLDHAWELEDRLE